MTFCLSATHPVLFRDSAACACFFEVLTGLSVSPLPYASLAPSHDPILGTSLPQSVQALMCNEFAPISDLLMCLKRLSIKHSPKWQDLTLHLGRESVSRVVLHTLKDVL